jgi:integrase
MKNEVAKPIGLSRPKGRGPQVRICIPLDLQPHYGGRKDFRFSLGARIGAEAKAEAHRLRAAKDAEFNAKRVELALLTAPLKDITPDMARVISEGVYAALMHSDDAARESVASFEALRELAQLAPISITKALGIGDARPAELPSRAPLDGLPDAEAQVLADLNALSEGGAAVDLARRRLSAVQPLADKVARKLGLALDWSSEGGRVALRQCLEQMRRAWKDRVARDAGEAIASPEMPQAPEVGRPLVAASARHTLRDAFDKWKASGDNPSAATIRKKDVAVRLFERFTQDAPIESLKPEQGGDFAGWLLKECAAQKTAKDHLDAVKSLLNKATKQGGLGWIAENPWAGHKINVRQSTARKPWTPDALRQLFDSPLFTAYALPKLPSAGAAAAYWVPLLGIYTGARLSELCQLRTTDVVESAGEGEATADMLAIFITAEAEDCEGNPGTSTKTGVSRRRIPVHPELIRLGFGDYWRDTGKAGHRALFPDMRKAPGRPAGEYFSDWFLIYRKERKVLARWADFHAFRHTASTRLTDAGVPDSVANYLTGHSSGERGSAGTYKHMQALRPAIAKLRYPELALARVYPKEG